MSIHADGLPFLGGLFFFSEATSLYGLQGKALQTEPALARCGASLMGGCHFISSTNDQP